MIWIFVVVVDCGSADRMGELHHLAEKVPYTLILDHHRSNDGFGTHSVIIPRADATAQLVLDVLDELDLELTKDIAQCLFAGLLTDTGGFHWGSPRAHSDAARLVQAGIDSDTLTRQLLDTRPFSYLELLATVLQTATLIQDAGKGRGLVYATVPYDVYRHARPEDVQALIEVVRTTAEAEIALVVREMTPGTWTGFSPFAESRQCRGNCPPSWRRRASPGRWFHRAEHVGRGARENSYHTE